jgi:alpha/beta superfamily hydrolase
MVMGDKDNFTSESAFMEIVKTMPQESTTGAVLKDADHFFRGREKDLMDILGKQEGDRRWTEHASSMSRERMFLCARVVDQWK